MPALSSDLRKTLETTVVKARDLAERGALDALTALAVSASEPFSTMGDDDRKLRNRLRAHARQLGDQRDPQKGTQGIERLVREMAYEHWHRMLFARFLAENQLLIEPSSGVSVSLDECEELAAEAGTDLWGMAAQFAQGMLPQIFRVDDPVLAAKLPVEVRQRLQAILGSLSPEIFSATDSLGWTYQFWRAAEKLEINEASRKIGADELPAVTQLFTEDYMVSFLLDNTLGAWHASKMLSSISFEKKNQASEVEVRLSISLPNEDWDYLRITRLTDGPWVPASGGFSKWPREAKNLRCIDPCMGSGHFMVAMLKKLVSLRQAEEALNVEDAVALVVRDNLYGLEIDARCTQIAAFNIALTAWNMAGRYFTLPKLNIACSGVTPACSRSEWMDIANHSEGLWETLSDGDAQRVTRGIGRLYDIFSSADLLGSLIDIRTIQGDLLTADYSLLSPFLDSIIKSKSLGDETSERVGAALGMSSAMAILNTSYDLVATNFPFLTQNKLPEPVNLHIRERCDYARAELATAFAALWLQRGQSIAFVSPSEWLYLGRFKDFRKHLLSNRSPLVLATLGFGSFETPLRVNPELSIIDSSPSNASTTIACLDISDSPKISEKKNALANSDLKLQKKELFLQDRDYRLLSRSTDDEEGHLLSVDADARAGMFAGDGEQFNFCFWEIRELCEVWEPLQSTVPETIDYGGRSYIVRWEQEEGAIARLAESVKHLNHAAQNWRRGKPHWGRSGVAVSLMGNLPCTLYTGEIYDMNCCALVPRDPSGLISLWNFCKSGRFGDLVREIDKSLKLTPKTLLKVHWNPDEWVIDSTPNEPVLPEVYSDDPTQWIFHGHPSSCSEDMVLQVALARIAGFRWPSEYDNRIRLGASGKGLAMSCAQISHHADSDGIVCFHALRGQSSAADRIRRILIDTLDGGLNLTREKNLISKASQQWNSKSSDSIEEWLKISFFSEHAKAFKSRPFLWHIWDGNSLGFEVIVNAHFLCGPNGQGKRTLETLIYTYLGDWIEMQKLASAEGVPGAELRLASAQDLKRRLENILAGDPPFDIFCRWKPLHELPIGWEPDINDGIRVNIRPFVKATLARGGKSGAGLLKSKPGSIKWASDKGRDPIENRQGDDYPWLWTYADPAPPECVDLGIDPGGSVKSPLMYEGTRRNDLHYTRAAKEAARARHRGEG